ncbi:MAG: hypothetical protein ABI402_11150 [Ferruginibacter sp.]
MGGDSDSAIQGCDACSLSIFSEGNIITTGRQVQLMAIGANGTVNWAISTHSLSSLSSFAGNMVILRAGAVAESITISARDSLGCQASIIIRVIACNLLIESSIPGSGSTVFNQVGVGDNVMLNAYNSNGTVSWRIVSGSAHLESNAGIQVNLSTHIAHGRTRIEATDDTGCSQTIDINVCAIAIQAQFPDGAPAGRATTRIHTGERLQLTASAATGSVRWQLNSGIHSRLDHTQGSVVVLTGHTQAETVVVTAIDSSGCRATLQVEVQHSKCVVHFRPMNDWTCNFGFDWLRIGGGHGERELANGLTESAYKDILTGGFGFTSPAAAYTHLKAEYEIISTEIPSPPENLAEYYVPYLNLFPRHTPEPHLPHGSPHPAFEATLKLLIEVQGNEPETIEFESTDTTAISIDRQTLSDKTVGAKRVSHDTVKITCNSEISSDQALKVWSTFLGVRTLVGKLKICANNNLAAKRIKFAFIKVRTDMVESGIPNVGMFDPAPPTHPPGIPNLSEIPNLINSMHQGLWRAEIVNAPDLDLTNDPNFKVVGPLANAQGFIDAATNTIIHTRPMKAYLRTAYFNIPENHRYQQDYFTVFSLGENNDDGVMGAIESIGTRNLVLWNTRDNFTMNHEVLHGLGLHHTHSDGAGNHSTQKYTYESCLHAGHENDTDNVMSYNANASLTTWHWQWELLR